MWTRESLLELTREKLRDYKFILVSNREPYVHRFENGAIECEQPVGGLTIALDPIMRACGGTWIATASGSADREVVDRFNRVKVPPEDPRYTLRRIWLEPRHQERYYNGLANRGLWPLCHIAFTRPVFRPEDWQAYREVNELFAQAVLEEAGSEPTFVFIQDFHFGLLPRMLKESNPNLIIAQFWHIPWPNPEVFRSFPWKEELLEGLLSNDLLGFHLRFHCQNFLDTVDRMLEAKVDRETFDITRGGKTTSVRPFPISIDFEEQDAIARSASTQREMERWRRELKLTTEFIGVGIDRIDYTKGIAERIRALDRFLREYPHYQGRITFVQIGVPSRSGIPEYDELATHLEKLTAAINAKYQRGSWRPVIFLEQHYPLRRLVALNRLANFCMVNSLHDGMNLVSKEFVASRIDEDGALILSDFAGASRELTDAIVVNPFSEEEGVEAIRQALEMPIEEQKRRMQRMRAVVQEYNVYRWAGKILSTLLKFEFASANEIEIPATRGSFY